jgi:glutamate racemase
MIGVFDSGLGGLTVLKALVEHLPNQKFVYLGDTARLPYGAKSGETILKYTEQNLHFLKKLNVQALVIACNSASAHWHSPEFEGLPVFTVIHPTSAQAAKLTRNKRVGLLATRATVGSNSYVKSLQEIDPAIELYAQAAPLLVPFAEEGLVNDPLTNLIVYRYAQPLLAENIDTLILGCTHYPILKEALYKVCGAQVELIESGHAVAAELTAYLEKNPQMTVAHSKTPRITVLTTDSSEHFKKWAQEILSPISVDQWNLVDLA